jgi:hypothetical protein
LKRKSHKKRAGGVAQGVSPEFKPQHHKKAKKRKKHQKEPGASVSYLKSWLLGRLRSGGSHVATPGK